MPLKILCAGYGKDEKSDLEKQVQTLLGRALGTGWTISLVKLGGQVSVSIDGPDERLKGKSFVVPPQRLRDSLRDMLTAHGFDTSEPEPVPAAVPAKGSSSRPPSGRFPAHATRAAVSTPPPASRPSSSSHAPAAPARPRGSASGRHARDEHACPNCSGRFVVSYELEPNDGRQLVAVACPHCWKIDRVEVAESAAISRAYRADKA